ncbi:MAG: phosphate/phosphite/phosphonate ABC transporter substrate-binding protein [Erysipelotrichaceae bacterium]
MKKLLSILLISVMIFGGLVACTAEPEVTEDTVIEDLVVLFVPSQDPGLILESTEPLKQLLIDTLGEKGYTVENVTIEVSTDYNAAGEALAAGTAHIGFLPGGTYVAYSADGVEVVLAATRAGLNKDSVNAADWNDGQPTTGDSTNQVTYYRSLIYAGTSEYGRILAEKVNAGTALTWEDLDGAQWCVAQSPSSSAGYIYPTVWLVENFDKKLTDLTKPPLPGSYGDIAANLASGLCDVGVGFADIRRNSEADWTTTFGRTESIWVETDVIGVTDKIFNDTISVSLNNPEMSEGFKKAVQEAFIEIAKTETGKAAVKVYSHEGYEVVTDADYDLARKAAEVAKG